MFECIAERLAEGMKALNCAVPVDSFMRIIYIADYHIFSARVI